MVIFRTVLLLLWALVTYVTVVAIGAHGIDAATTVFAQDLLAGNWRSQFNTDLLAHIVLVASWVAWRQKFSPLGILLAVLCILGGLFSLLYVLILSFYHRGDLRAVVMGKQVS